MSFSAVVRRELAGMIPEDSELFSAELQSLSLYDARLTETDGSAALRVLGESGGSTKKYFTFIKKTDKIKTDFTITMQYPNGKTKSHDIVLAREDTTVPPESAGLGYEDGESEIGRKLEQKLSGEEEWRVFLRGVFLAAGSIPDPTRFYHLEFVCPGGTKAWYLKLLLSTPDATAGIVQWKGYYVMHVKDSDNIANLLGRMGAPRALLALEEIRVLKNMRNRMDRTVSYETVNLQRTVVAALKQWKDTGYIHDAGGFDDLPSALAGMAEIRLEYPDMFLKELGARLDSPVGKSGVNHRLRKLSEYADELRGKRKEEWTMIKKSMIVKLNGEKADAIPAVMLVQITSQYENSIYMDDTDEHVNAKSTMGMMTLRLANGLEIVVTANGKDGDATIAGIEEYPCQ